MLVYIFLYVLALNNNDPLVIMNRDEKKIHGKKVDYRSAHHG